jgi:hypothetical protein
MWITGTHFLWRLNQRLHKGRNEHQTMPDLIAPTYIALNR